MHVKWLYAPALKCPSTETVYPATSGKDREAAQHVARRASEVSSCLRECCAMSVYGATGLRACYAMYGTEIAYGATRDAAPARMSTSGRLCYSPTRVLRDVRY
eukprot:3480297-Rhodomonas_salina.4